MKNYLDTILQNNSSKSLKIDVVKNNCETTTEDVAASETLIGNH